MQPVSGRTLMMAIQAVEAERERLRAEVAATADEMKQADLEELEVTYFKAATELRDAYIEECRTSLNLPRYEDLVNE
jgi:hypothetical protein